MLQYFLRDCMRLPGFPIQVLANVSVACQLSLTISFVALYMKVVKVAIAFDFSRPVICDAGPQQYAPCSVMPWLGSTSGQHTMTD